MKTRSLAAAVALLVATSAQAAFMDGNALLTNLNGNYSERIVALGYIISASDAGNGEGHCLPPRMTAEQVAMAVKKQIQTAPEILTMNAYPLVRAALANTWPCRGVQK